MFRRSAGRAASERPPHLGTFDARRPLGNDPGGKDEGPGIVAGDVDPRESRVRSQLPALTHRVMWSRSDKAERTGEAQDGDPYAYGEKGQTHSSPASDTRCFS
jgi:hypothetical protein